MPPSPSVPERPPERPRAAFPRSAAYVDQPRAEQVSAAALLIAYAQVGILGLMCEGASRGAASDAQWRLFYEVLVPAAGGKAAPIPPDVQFRSPRCLADSVAAAGEALGAGWGEFCRRHGPYQPVALLGSNDDRNALHWLCETVRRVASGGELLEAARGAHDAYLGRPRRKRQPVEADWLIGEVTPTLDHAWWALVQARRYQGGPPWLRGVTEQRPIAPLEGG
jgi:hypothetical protein